MPSKKRIPLIVCGGEAGRCVVFGYVDKVPNLDEPVTLHKARMVITWSKLSGGLFGLAQIGPRGDHTYDTRLSPAVEFTTQVAKQIISVSETAAQELDEWKSFES